MRCKWNKTHLPLFGPHTPSPRIAQEIVLFSLSVKFSSSEFSCLFSSSDQSLNGGSLNTCKVGRHCLFLTTKRNIQLDARQHYQFLLWFLLSSTVVNSRISRRWRRWGWEGKGTRSGEHPESMIGYQNTTNHQRPAERVLDLRKSSLPIPPCLHVFLSKAGSLLKVVMNL